MSDSNHFLHESLQDQQSIADFLDAIRDGIQRGELSLTDDNGKMKMTPSGLLDLRIKSFRDQGHNKLTLSISWSEPATKTKKDKTLEIG